MINFRNMLYNKCTNLIYLKYPYINAGSLAHKYRNFVSSYFQSCLNRYNDTLSDYFMD